VPFSAANAVNEVVAGNAKRMPFHFSKSGITPKTTASWVSAFLAAAWPSPGVAPTTIAGATLTRATPGALAQPNASPGTNLHISGLHAYSNALAGIVAIEDRVWANLITLNSAVAQPVASVPFARDVNGAANGMGFELWFECYTATAATVATITVTYTNALGVAGRTATAAIPASMSPGQRVQFSMQSGDMGVGSVQSVISSVAIATGTGGLVVSRRLCSAPMPAAAPTASLDLDLGLPRVFDDSCLAVTWLGYSPSATVLGGSIRFTEG
jgi:hypothetical protein